MRWPAKIKKGQPIEGVLLSTITLALLRMNFEKGAATFCHINHLLQQHDSMLGLTAFPIKIL